MKTLQMMLEEQHNTLTLDESHYSSDVYVDDEDFDETSSVGKQWTGLDTIIYVYQNLYNRYDEPVIGFQNSKTDKIMNPDLHLTISKNPHIIERIATKAINVNFDKVQKWIIKNSEILLKIWNSKISVDDGLFKLSKV